MHNILGKLRVAFDVHSPSRKTRALFKNVMIGAEKGLEDEENNLYNQANNIAEGVLDRLNSNNMATSSNYSQYNSTNNNLFIDYNQLYLCFLKALNNCKMMLDEEGFVRIIDDRMREVM